MKNFGRDAQNQQKPPPQFSPHDSKQAKAINQNKKNHENITNFDDGWGNTGNMTNTIGGAKPLQY
jgi:hypothetical protein